MTNTLTPPSSHYRLVLLSNDFSSSVWEIFLDVFREPDAPVTWVGLTASDWELSGAALLAHSQTIEYLRGAELLEATGHRSWCIARLTPRDFELLPRDFFSRMEFRKTRFLLLYQIDESPSWASIFTETPFRIHDEPASLQFCVDQANALKRMS